MLEITIALVYEYKIMALIIGILFAFVSIQRIREYKNDKYKDDNNATLNSKSYAGQFHTDYSGLKDRVIMGMDGASGQSILIDFERSKIVVINSIHTDYNWKKIAHSVIKKG